MHNSLQERDDSKSRSSCAHIVATIMINYDAVQNTSIL